MAPPHTQLWERKERGSVMGILQKLFDVLYPPTCLLCGKPAEVQGVLCDGCYRQYAGEAFLRCGRCAERAGRCECGIDSFRQSVRGLAGRHMAYLTFYVGTEKAREDGRITEQMIFRLKKRNEFVAFFASELCREVRTLFEEAGESLDGWVITYPPRSEEKYREYGFDQSEEMARLMAKELGIPCIRTFRRSKDAVEQKALDRSERLSNAENTLIPIPGRIPKGGKILLLDDVITSGATVSTAMRHLYFHGASAVFPIAIAKNHRSGE